MIGSPEFIDHVARAAVILTVASVIAAAAFQIIKDWWPHMPGVVMANGSGLLSLILTVDTLARQGLDPFIALSACLVATQLPKALHDGVRYAGSIVNSKPGMKLKRK